MARLFFVIGGARSGKSSFALDMANGLDREKTYLATACAQDGEMAERIKKHRLERGQDWNTMEEKTGIASIIENLEGVVLVDCLTLWVTNLMMDGLDEAAILDKARSFISSCKRAKADVIAVSNEVGLGIVPDNVLARKFRDIAGLVNQKIAKEADEVFFVASGIPLKMK